MKVSEIDKTTMANYLHEFEDNLTGEEIALLEHMKVASVAYAKNYTGLDDEELDKHEDITMAVLSLVSSMWDNRSVTINLATLNPTVEGILSMHRTNLLPDAEA